jgi:hypothetical protein
MICTDSAANCKLARKLLLQKKGFRHLINARCQMHNFNLLQGSILGHPYFKVK